MNDSSGRDKGEEGEEGKGRGEVSEVHGFRLNGRRRVVMGLVRGGLKLWDIHFNTPSVGISRRNLMGSAGLIWTAGRTECRRLKELMLGTRGNA